MSMTSIVFGILMILVGLGGFFGSGTSSPTALIPAGFGVALVILGLVARNPGAAKHAMHAAAAISLLGIAGTTSRALGVMQMMQGQELARPAAAYASAATWLLCVVFLGLCIRSFIAARRARNAA